MSRLALVVGITVTTVTCNKSPAEPTTQACERNNTAIVVFGNRSQNTTQDVYLDGAKILTLPPGSDSPAQTLAAGVPHTVDFRITNTNVSACAVSSPVYAQCSQRIQTCAFP